MAQILKQSTAVDVLIGPFVDLTDGATAETAESPSVKLSKNGQTLAAKNDVTTPVHDADGYYNCELDATDTNTVGTMVLTVAASANALPVRHEFQVIEEAIYDALIAASAAGFDANQRVDVGEVLGTAQTAGDIMGTLGAAGAGLTAVPWNAAWDAEVQSECADALTAYDPPTNAEMEARTIVSANYATSSALATVDANVDTLVADTPNRPSKNVQLNNFAFLMVDSTDFATPETGLTVSGTVSKDGGVFAALTNSVSEVGNGIYVVTVTATEMNADTVVLRFTATGAADRFVTIYTQPT